ncbi:MAG: MBL fold metallo-hydrolase [Nonomuraea sp.]|nr:MBL fold metallo-hydrolase [Nonomuraea sp.]
MKIHHLSFGTMRETDPDRDGFSPAAVVNHCLLIETDRDGLVLVETGFGTVDVERPAEALGQTFLDRTAPNLDAGQTALSQVRELGFAPQDVRHIVLTHLDLDHSGGLPDFPGAKVHLHEAEVRAALAATSAHPEHAVRYRPAHWAHQPDWVTYESRKGESWFGFDALELTGLPPEILLIPLAGHTEGHCAVAVRDGARWLLHAGDAFYHQGQIEPGERWDIPMWEPLNEITEVDRPLRLGNLARLRELARDHGDEVAVFSAHDPWAFAALRG